MSTPDKFIQVRGARQHNLRGIDVDLPRNALSVITGLSGSGKSSLAFDTIFAEGQRRYVESLSVHARQFLDQMPKPLVERIDGLCPTLAIDQRTATSNPRSTVATQTEIYDFLRLLFARAGTPHCWICGRSIGRQTTAEIVDAALALPTGTRLMVLAPLVHDQRGSHRTLLADLARQGYVRARIDERVVHLEDCVELQPQATHRIDVVVDRLAVSREQASRLGDSIELALRTGGHRVILAVEQDRGVFDDHPFSTHFACPEHPEVSLPDVEPRLFSFNSPHGACPACHGLGTVLEFDPELVVPDPRRPLADGAIAPLHPSSRRTATPAPLVAEFCTRFNVAPEISFCNLPPELAHCLLHGSPHGTAIDASFVGALPWLEQRWSQTESKTVKEKLHAYRSEAACTQCGGGRLRREALAVRVDQRNLADLGRLTIAEARLFFDALAFDQQRAVVAAPILREVRARLRFLCDVGVDYLSLDRPSQTLSGGEAQRIRLATQIGGGLVGVCYVLDEPTVGLHQRDSQRLVATLQRLTAAGNTVIVVEHDEEMIAAAEHVVDLGPGAGSHGGAVVAAGSLVEVLQVEQSATAQYLTGRRRIDLPEERRAWDARAVIKVHDATANNLKGIDVSFPLGCFICVTGVSGSGKSTLVGDVLVRTLRRALIGSGPRPGAHRRIAGSTQVDRIVEINQAPIGRSPRSNPATYVGVFDLIRQLYARTREAKIRGYAPVRFSFNVKGGRCEVCQGQGTRRIEMHFLPDVFVVCDACGGTRYNRETLDVRYRGHTIADVLDLSVEDAARFFTNFPKIRRLLRALLDVGLGYMKLGQSSLTLSGGEAQRIKLAAELGKPASGHTLYVLDEPTTGLHLADVHQLVGVLDRLVSLGHTMIVIEHNLEVIKVADHVIDLGPGGGDAGGYLVVAGTPEQVADCPDSCTGRFLRPRLVNAPMIDAAAVPTRETE